MNILVDASLPGLDAAFPAPFKMTRYHSEQEIPALLSGQDVLLCRSTLKVNAQLLKNQSLRFVATASSGTDHLDHEYLAANNIQIIDAKGCNARSVADYVLACLAYLNPGRLKAGIIGMGAVGTQVYQRLAELDFQITCFDPLRALHDPQFVSCALADLADCDLLCIHAELHATQPFPSVDLFDCEFLASLKPGCILINAARGGIVNEEALLKCQQGLVYCTDVYLNEPAIDWRIVDFATLCTPHIAGHSLEAKCAAVAFVSEKLHGIAGLPVPVFARPMVDRMIKVDKNAAWQDKVLSFYNPLVETVGLKQAEDLKAAFLALRVGHNFRHDFDVYY